MDENCLYSTVTRGISLGCPLSPVMAAIYLEPLRRMEATGLSYARFMDDWVILAPKRWSLRRAIRTVNEMLRELRVEQHPDKTFIGRIERGFTFLGYWITEKGVTGVAPSTWDGFQERVARLYEQDAPQQETRRRIGQYVRRWRRWVLGGLGASFSLSDWADQFQTWTSGLVPGSLSRGTIQLTWKGERWASAR
ncbi:MAG: reverse transcriptase domain-containing protein [Bryobacteraceae bacterium]